jgi:hypothetical protein
MPDTNPLLDEINNLSPGAKSALMQAHQQGPNPAIAAARAPIQPPPAPTGMQAPSQIQAPPQMNAPQPQVSLAPQPKGTLAGDQQAMQQMAAHKAPLESVYSGVTHSNFGQNHPVMGKILGALGQIPATAADVVASGVAPRLGALIPGTSIHRGLQMSALQDRIGAEQKGQQEEAVTRATNAEVPLREAQTQHEQAITQGLPGEQAEKQRLEDAQIQNLLHPQAKTAFEDWRATNPNAPTADFFKAQNEAKPDKAQSTKEQLQSQLVAAQNKGDTAGAAKLQKQLRDIDPLGETRVTIQQQGQTNANNRARDAKTEAEYTWTRNNFDKQLSSYRAQNEKLSEASGFIGKGAMGDALASIKALSGLAGGQGSGVRITQAELNSIARSRNLGGDFEVAMSKFGDAKNLSDAQRAQLKGIIEDINRIARAKQSVINKALDDLGEANDTQTMRKIYSQVRHALGEAQ